MLKIPKHHASTAHMTQDQVWVPTTRSQGGLSPLDPKREDRLGSRASAEVQKELWEALGDSPIGASFGVAMFLVRFLFLPRRTTNMLYSASQLVGWPMYILTNAAGQRRYPKGTNRMLSRPPLPFLMH